MRIGQLKTQKGHYLNLFVESSPNGDSSTYYCLRLREREGKIDRLRFAGHASSCLNLIKRIQAKLELEGDSL